MLLCPSQRTYPSDDDLSEVIISIIYSITEVVSMLNLWSVKIYMDSVEFSLFYSVTSAMSGLD